MFFEDIFLRGPYWSTGMKFALDFPLPIFDTKFDTDSLWNNISKNNSMILPLNTGNHQLSDNPTIPSILPKKCWRRVIKERNWKYYYSSTRLGLLYKEYEKCGLLRKRSIYLPGVWCCWENSCIYCVRMLKSTTEEVQTSKKNIAKMKHWKLCESSIVKWFYPDNFMLFHLFRRNDFARKKKHVASENQLRKQK